MLLDKVVLGNTHPFPFFTPLLQHTSDCPALIIFFSPISLVLLIFKRKTPAYVFFLTLLKAPALYFPCKGPLMKTSLWGALAWRSSAAEHNRHGLQSSTLQQCLAVMPLDLLREKSRTPEDLLFMKDPFIKRCDSNLHTFQHIQKVNELLLPCMPQFPSSWESKAA